MKDFWWYQAGMTFFFGVLLVTFAMPDTVPVITGNVVAESEAEEGVSLAVWGFGFALASFVELVTFSVAHIAKRRYKME